MHVSCCIAGGGPAGMMLGLLLARAGVDVLVLEKHGDFLRDFRGDTIHPSTLELMYELGVLDEFLSRPHQKLKQLAGQFGNELIPFADFSHLPTKCKYIVFMPQWHFLDFVADLARQYPTFQLWMDAEVTDLIETNGRIVGAKVETKEGPQNVTSDLVVGADGRTSLVRERAGLTVQELGAPMDVMWFRISRQPDDPSQVLGRFAGGRVMVMLNRGDYWQCGYLIAKGSLDQVKQRGIEAFRQDMLSVAPFLCDRANEIRDWDDIRLLTVRVDRLRKWYRAGLLCIGDAAHAMSPVGGIGINVAVQDAVAAANILAESLKNKTLTEKDLEKVQRRRLFATRVTQAAQVFMQNRVLKPILGNTKQISVPFVLRLFQWFPFLRRIPARLVGVGVRAEHVRTPDAFKGEKGKRGRGEKD
ncbi:MAG TPA: FAD-dependent oxidoreductase [Pyrinomonadaceae bacterium]|nr:FAD-dependent oxidoreductase [Pyrinomonadaceae bacterium]